MHRKQISWVLRTGMFLLSITGMAMVARRTLAIAGILPAVSSNGTIPFDTGFGKHPVITFLHILPGFLFMLLGPWQFMPGIRNRYSRFHREWMIRAFAIGLAVSTVRPIVGMFFAFSGLAPQVFFGTAFWIGFTLHFLVAEVWINYTRG
ncbi:MULTISPECIES: hypothetical protein [unclassified Chitinophaga]|uniref:hypothetical protein n=1 Tax=unclassified Chitinophaga TaxID=2619133 RepID=UPI00300F8A49